MNIEAMQQRIRMRFYRCNEMDAKKCDDYAAIAVHEIQKYMAELENINREAL